MELYVYYRAACADAAELKSRVVAMQQQLRQRHGVQAALKRRPEAEAGMHTWMEVYLAAPHDFARELDQAAQDAGLPALIHGSRHVEHFMDSASCA